MNRIQGNHYSASSLYSSGSDVDLIEAIETKIGVSHLVVKKMTISASSANKIKFNNEDYWSDLLASGSMFNLSLGAGDVMISNMYLQNTTGCNVNIDIIY